MKKQTLSLLLLTTLSLPAFADLADTGNLEIGGQGLIRGTFTIEGNAMSVGGSTLSVSGGQVLIGAGVQVSTLNTSAGQYSLETSSGIKMGNSGCLKFGDGTSQCSATSGGTYNVAFSSDHSSTQYTNGTSYVPLVGSSTTITLSGTNRVRLSWSGLAENTQDISGCSLQVFENGTSITNNDIARCVIAGGAAGYCGFNIISEEMSGMHTFYVGFRRIGVGNNCQISGAESTWYFIVEEIKG
jgi:hypothetical protein